MFARVFALLPLVALVAATGESQCNTGAINCCNTVGSSSSPEIESGLNALNLGGLLGGVLADVSGLIGLGCSPIVGSTVCSQQPVCCEDNTFNGLINLGCSPININL